MADCIPVEAARQATTDLATSDLHLLDLCRRENIPTIVLTGSDGTKLAAQHRFDPVQESHSSQRMLTIE
jgi:hypothetical protein